MRPAIIVAILLASCSQQEPTQNVGPTDGAAPQAGFGSAWDMQSSDEGAALVIADARGSAALRLFCPAGARKLLVNVPGFNPIGSEERLSFGQGGEVLALVADPSGDSARGGVTGEGPLPGNLVALLSGQVAASYGAQVSGPHPTPPAALVDAFASACTGGTSSEGAAPSRISDGSPAPADPPSSPARGSPCLVQDGKAVPANAIRGVGTEPFWGVRVQGRCVTYSHPDDQAGTRVWTKFSGSKTNGTWSGSLGGKPFVMRTRPQAGCSDGMSDRRYPIAVSLTVGGEQRSGCAEPL